MQEQEQDARLTQVRDSEHAVFCDTRQEKLAALKVFHAGDVMFGYLSITALQTRSLVESAPGVLADGDTGGAGQEQ